MVPVKPDTSDTPVTRSRNEEIARHEAMAGNYRGAHHKSMFDPAVHCDRLIAQLRKASDAFSPKGN